MTNELASGRNGFIILAPAALLSFRSNDDLGSILQNSNLAEKILDYFFPHFGDKFPPNSSINKFTGVLWTIIMDCKPYKVIFKLLKPDEIRFYPYFRPKTVSSNRPQMTTES
jgi:hypothetical protein